MGEIISKDGTVLAFDRVGEGPSLVLAGPDRVANAPMAAFSAPHFTVYTLDRRGHGQSGDTPLYATEREI